MRSHDRVALLPARSERRRRRVGVRATLAADEHAARGRNGAVPDGRRRRPQRHGAGVRVAVGGESGHDHGECGRCGERGDNGPQPRASVCRARRRARFRWRQLDRVHGVPCGQEGRGNVARVLHKRTRTPLENGHPGPLRTWGALGQRRAVAPAAAHRAFDSLVALASSFAESGSHRGGPDSAGGSARLRGLQRAESRDRFEASELPFHVDGVGTAAQSDSIAERVGRVGRETHPLR